MKHKNLPILLMASAMLLGSCGTANASSEASSSAASEAASSVASEAASSVSSEAASSAETEVSSEEAEASSEEAVTYGVKSFDNLTTNFLSCEAAKDLTFAAGEEVSFDIAPGEDLVSGFEAVHVEHVFVYVNGEGFHPTLVDSNTMRATFTAPEADVDIIICYSVQQQLKEDGFNISLAEDSEGELLGVLASDKYKYFDCYVKFDTPYEITTMEYKMGEGDYIEVDELSYDVSYSRVLGRTDVYNITIRPDYEDVTGDVVVRIAGEEKQVHSITYSGLSETYVDLESSNLPASSIEGEGIMATLSLKEGYYIASVEADDEDIWVSFWDGSVMFTMPDADVVLTFTFGEMVALTASKGEHIVEATFYSDRDMFYGVPVESAIPGKTTYLFVKTEAGYKPTPIALNGYEYSFASYDGATVWMAALDIPTDATEFSVSVSADVAYSVSSPEDAVVAFSDGAYYFAGETVSFSVQIPSRTKLESVSIVDENGTDLNLAVELDGAYGTFTMPEANVKVVPNFVELTGDYVHVSAEFDEDEYSVSSSTDWDWDFAEGFDVELGSTFFLSIYDYNEIPFYVGIL
ncbi:MAG: hypothetical protein K6F32_03850, partial [Bacilli bacterium]|nr:hypothetical protein [Bacilli bacterium]